MPRYGPLQVLNDGVVLGDPGRRNLLLVPDGLHYRDASEVQHRYSWDEVTSLGIDVPTTRFRFPGVISGVVSVVLVAFTQEDPHLDPAEGSVSITTSDSATTLPLDRHHLGSYWVEAVRRTQRMLDRLLTDPPSRRLLRHPRTLLRAVAAPRTPDGRLGP